ncbi:MAG: hypothetical protein Q7R22_004475 [Verrucomicrobiota bacterium JB025]|nr:hypothetical protein [Verrucomicrobiota bacterium JB025]
MTAYLFSCVNATCAIPEAYREIFRGAEDVVQSREGWEPGSLNLGQAFAMKYRTPLVHGDVTRLLIDFEQDGDARWSKFAMKLPEGTRVKIVDRHEKPFRVQLMQRIVGDLKRNERVLHLMIHTDPETEGRVTLDTPADAPLAEKIGAEWCLKLRNREVDARHFRNVALSPLAEGLARRFPADRYAQVRLLVSQGFFLEGRPWKWEKLKKILLETLKETDAAG